MPHFFFDTICDQDLARDEVGIELPDLEAARQEAIRVLPDIARDELPNDGNRRDIMTDVRDETGRVVFTAQLSFTARLMT
jgi:hypothetical protein